MARFLLKVQQAGSRCIFDLSQRGTHTSQSAVLRYPYHLIAPYLKWLQAYLDYYEHFETFPDPPALPDKLRGRRMASGQAPASPTDRYSRLAQAEAALLADFHSWLRDPELYDIRATLARTSQVRSDLAQLPAELTILCARDPKDKAIPPAESSNQTSSRDTSVQAPSVLSSYPYEPRAARQEKSFDLARLPWESWEVNAEFAARGQLFISRVPNNLRERPPVRVSYNHWRRPRILVILGDESGLNFQKEKAAMTSLRGIAEIEFSGWQPKMSRTNAIQTIQDAIAAEPGWDILYFAGHSDETDLTGGELSIAPSISISIRDIAAQIQLAQKQGLQFALFNSCRGIEIAKALIQLGLGQVAIMRERIHDRVAQQFLEIFVRRLAQHEDVQTALFRTCQELETNYKQTYPSAYLLPSLYRHPDTELFAVRRFGWQQQLRRLVPSRWEAIASVALVTASLSFPLLGWNSPVQAWLLEHRMLVQGIYRQLTNQMPQAEPSILLVQIDDLSLTKSDIGDRYPMNRAYLASLIDRAVDLKFPIIGLDYILSDSQKEDEALIRALQAGASRNQALFVFAAYRQSSDSEWILAHQEIANPDWSWHGDIRIWAVGDLDYPIYPSLLPSKDRLAEKNAPGSLPLAYVLALGDTLYERSPEDFQAVRNRPPEQFIEELLHPRMKVRKSTKFFYSSGQIWLRPEFDFSLPPERVFSSISSWEFLNSDANELGQKYPQSTIVIVPGNYEEADDSFYAPRPIKYWNGNLENINGGELHAYAFHHFRHKHLVIRIPDLWLMLLVIPLGKVTALALQNHPQRRHWGLGLVGLTLAYGLISLQVYISGQIVFGWTLPSAIFWIYNSKLFRRKIDAA